MKSAKLPVIWKSNAEESLANIFYYVFERSPANAENMIIEITEKANSLNFWPEKYQRETIDKSERNIRRAFAQNCRIVYEVTTEAIYILDILYAAQSSDKLSKL